MLSVAPPWQDYLTFDGRCPKCRQTKVYRVGRDKLATRAGFFITGDEITEIRQFNALPHAEAEKPVPMCGQCMPRPPRAVDLDDE